MIPCQNRMQLKGAPLGALFQAGTLKNSAHCRVAYVPHARLMFQGACVVRIVL